MEELARFRIISSTPRPSHSHGDLRRVRRKGPQIPGADGYEMAARLLIEVLIVKSISITKTASLTPVPTSLHRSPYWATDSSPDLGTDS